jgi:hypothetical protein
MEKGFIALIAVLLLSLGTLAFSLATMSAATLYADSVKNREVRIQNRLNERACIDMAQLLAAQDPFLEGVIHMREFGCSVDIQRDSGAIQIKVISIQLTHIF